MVKMVYAVAGVAIVLAFAIIGAAVYSKGGVPSLDALLSPPEGIAGNGTVTALQAFAIADNNASVKAWKADGKNVSVAQISTDFLDGGTSDTWTITYASDSGEAAAHVEKGAMAGMTATATAERLYPVHNTMLSGLVDSPAASDTAYRAMAGASVSSKGPASASLEFKASGAPVWDLNYPLDGGNYVVRIDAVGGAIVESATLRR